MSYQVTLDFMAEWWSIEVFDTRIQAALQWKDSYRTQIVEAAIGAGALELPEPVEQRVWDLTEAEPFGREAAFHL